MSCSKLLRLMIRAASFTLLVIVLVVWEPGVTSTQGPPSQKNEPSPPAEVKSPIVSIMVASSIDEKGKLVNPGFTFPQNEPQITAVVWVGKIKDSQLKVAWYKTSENGDEKLFEHQIQVKSNDRAFSICKNASGTLALGTYKVVATLEGQTEDVEFDVSPPKAQQNKTSNILDEKLFEDEPRSEGINHVFSIRTTSGGLLTAARYELVAGLEPQMQKIVLDVSSQTTRATVAGSTPAQGKLPVAGTSGTVSQPPNPPSGPETAGCSVKVYGGEILANRDFGADTVQIKSEVVCKSRNVVYVHAGVGDFPNPLNPVGTYAVSAGQYTSTVFNVDPCWLPGGSDLPGTKVSVEAAIEDTAHKTIGTTPLFVVKEVITLFDDILAPRVNVVSTPARGTTVKAGDKISLQVTAQERRRKGPWQTGVKVIQVAAIPGGLVKDWVNPSNLPKPCTKKTWEQNLDATYTVPSNPPPTIKICAIAEDYQGNELSQCGEFYTVDTMPANCRRKGYARVAHKDGTPLLHDENKITCRVDYYICGNVYKKTTVVDNQSNACESFFNSVEANLPKEAFCCDCYPKCGEQRKPHK